MKQWMNQKLASKGRKKISQEQYMAYISLEVAMSFAKLNQVRIIGQTRCLFSRRIFRVWCQGIFFRIFMIVLCYTIRSSMITILPVLIHCTIAGIRWGISYEILCALDENFARTKASCAAVTFNAEKPDKFAIRFYCVVSTSHTYVHSMMDNRSGNKTQQTAPEAYCQLFLELCTP